jgi:hypothetical protein
MINPVAKYASLKYGCSEGNFNPQERWMWEFVMQYFHKKDFLPGET